MIHCMFNMKKRLFAVSTMYYMLCFAIHFNSLQLQLKPVHHKGKNYFETKIMVFQYYDGIIIILNHLNYNCNLTQMEIYYCNCNLQCIFTHVRHYELVTRCNFYRYRNTSKNMTVNQLIIMMIQLIKLYVGIRIE